MDELRRLVALRCCLPRTTQCFLDQCVDSRYDNIFIVVYASGVSLRMFKALKRP